MTDSLNEEWREIPNFPTYSVSNLGRLRRDPHKTFNKGNNSFQYCKGGILKLCDDGKGYLKVGTYINGRYKSLYVHQAVMWAFVGKQEKGMEVRHLNSNPSDNRLENLSYGTKSDNMQDAVKIGTLVFSRSSLSKEDVVAIGKDPRPINIIAKSFNVCEATIINIKQGKSFKGWTEEIIYSPKKPRYLTKEEMDIILNTSIPRKEVMRLVNITFAQVKKVRHTKKNVIFQ